LPTFTAGVAIMILWKALYNPDFGPVNAAINWVLDTFNVNDLVRALGGTSATAPAWLLSTKNLLGLGVEQVRVIAGQWGLGARDALIIMGIWIAIGGNNMLLYIAGISNIPEELVEAAQLDGAGSWAVFRHVTWPQLAPTTFFIVVMSFIGGLQGGFEQARVMTQGGPAGTTTTIAYYIYTKAFEEFQIGYASALSWILFSIIFVITIVNWRLGHRELSY
jgi:multiple sugar transport system permease protein